MADSLVPWISDYLINVAETFGAKISDIPSYKKRKKVQIIKFLTYGSEVEDTLIWAQSSDKDHSIPIKFTKEAISEYRRNSGGQRITQHKGAIATIKDFRPIFTLVPLGGGLTSRSFLAFECTSFNILGSSGEGTFGDPQPIANLSDIQLWSEGLSREGGAGNILKERKMQRESGIAVDAPMSLPVIPPVAVQTPVEVTKVQVLTTRSKKACDLASYAVAWQTVTKTTNYQSLPGGKMIPNGDIVESAPAISEALSHSPTQEPNKSSTLNSILNSKPDVNTPRARSATPISNWGSSPSVMKENSSPIESPKFLKRSSAVLPSPTPGQRTRVPMTVPVFTPDQTSSYPSGNETVMETEPPDFHSQDVAARRPVPRKIPRPTSPEPPKNSGPELILAPNSDTSGTQSQLQLNSQSQSQPGHGQPEQIESSQLIVYKGKSIVEPEEHDASMDVDDEQFLRSQSSPEKEATKNHGQRRTSVDERSPKDEEDIDEPRIVRDEQNIILGAVNMNAEDARMDEEYPWLDLWQIRDIMARTAAARSTA